MGSWVGGWEVIARVIKGRRGRGLAVRAGRVVDSGLGSSTSWRCGAAVGGW